MISKSHSSQVPKVGNPDLIPLVTLEIWINDVKYNQVLNQTLVPPRVNSQATLQYFYCYTHKDVTSLSPLRPGSSAFLLLDKTLPLNTLISLYLCLPISHVV